MIYVKYEFELSEGAEGGRCKAGLEMGNLMLGGDKARYFAR